MQQITESEDIIILYNRGKITGIPWCLKMVIFLLILIKLL